jgi:hypothetical protein
MDAIMVKCAVNEWKNVHRTSQVPDDQSWDKKRMEDEDSNQRMFWKYFGPMCNI